MKTKNDIWYLIAFGWILHGMRDNKKGELKNAKEARKILDYAIKEAKKK